MNTTIFEELVNPSNDFYYMVIQRVKSKAPVSGAKPVQKSSTKFASIKPETRVLLTQDPLATKPHQMKNCHGSWNKKQKHFSRAIQSRRTQQGKEKEPGIFDGYQDKNYFFENKKWDKQKSMS